MAVFGLCLVIITEPVMRAVTHNPNIIAPHSWWDMSGHIVAAVYCIALHALLAFKAHKPGIKSPGSRHTLMRIPVWGWSIGYIILGVIRVASPK